MISARRHGLSVALVTQPRGGHPSLHIEDGRWDAEFLTVAYKFIRFWKLIPRFPKELFLYMEDFHGFTSLRGW